MRAGPHKAGVPIGVRTRERTELRDGGQATAVALPRVSPASREPPRRRGRAALEPSPHQSEHPCLMRPRSHLAE